MKLTITKRIRLTSEMDNQIIELAESTGFKKEDLIRHLINRSLMQLRSDCGGDFSKLEFSLKR